MVVVWKHIGATRTGERGLSQNAAFFFRWGRAVSSLLFWFVSVFFRLFPVFARSGFIFVFATSGESRNVQNREMLPAAAVVAVEITTSSLFNDSILCLPPPPRRFPQPTNPQLSKRGLLASVGRKLWAENSLVLTWMYVFVFKFRLYFLWLHSALLCFPSVCFIVFNLHASPRCYQ